MVSIIVFELVLQLGLYLSNAMTQQFSRVLPPPFCGCVCLVEVGLPYTVVYKVHFHCTQLNKYSSPIAFVHISEFLHIFYTFSIPLQC